MEAVQKVRERKQDRILRKYTLRVVDQAFKRWKQRHAAVEGASRSSNGVLQRWRMRLLRQAFDIYRDRAKEARVFIRNLSSAEQFEATVKKRRLRAIFEAIADHQKFMQLAKKHWRILMIRVDLGAKQDAIKRWQDKARKKKLRQLQLIQNNEA